MRNLADLIENQFPSFVRSEGPRLVAFLKAYYSWVDANQIDLVSTSDIDTTLDDFIKYFKNDVMQSIPANVVVDQRRLMKHIKDLWISKGNENSLALLFRILFDEDIEVYYPREDILKASDGRWVAETSVRIAGPFVGNPLALDGAQIFGSSSGATARVERVVSSIERGIHVYELYISGLEGMFVARETIHDVEGNNGGQCFNVIGPVSTLTVTKGGAYHQINDIVDVVQIGGSAATAKVKEVTDRSAVNFVVTDGGSGYRVGVPTTCDVIGGSGAEATFSVASISNPEVVVINTDLIKPVKNVTVNTLAKFPSAGANTSVLKPKFANSAYTSTLLSALTFENVTVGTIATLNQTHGYGYVTHPTAMATDYDVVSAQLSDGHGGIKGENAIISVQRAPGSITKANIINPGLSYSNLETAALVNARVGTEAATSIPNVEGVTKYPGRYVDTHGWLSWNNKLQDNEYYQAFSYVVKSSQFVNDYREIIKKTVHPAGTAMFGELSIRDIANVDGVSVTNEVITSVNAATINVGSATTVSDDLYRIWVEIHNSDFIYKVKDIVLNTSPFGLLGANSAVITTAFANSSINTQIQAALTYPTYFHDLTEGPGYITIVSGSNTVNGVGTNFTGMTFGGANTYVVLENKPGDTDMKLYQVSAIANNTSLTIDSTYNHPSITSGRLLFYKV